MPHANISFLTKYMNEYVSKQIKRSYKHCKFVVYNQAFLHEYAYKKKRIFAYIHRGMYRNERMNKWRNEEGRKKERKKGKKEI